MGDDHQISPVGTAFQEESIGHPFSGANDIIVTRSRGSDKSAYLYFWLGCRHETWAAARYSFSLCTPSHVLRMSLCGQLTLNGVWSSKN